MKYPIVYVEWLDHCSANEDWTPVDEAEASPVLMQTVGFLIKKDKDYIQLALTVDPNQLDCAQSMTIIKSCIKKQTTLRRGKK